MATMDYPHHHVPGKRKFLEETEQERIAKKAKIDVIEALEGGQTNRSFPSCCFSNSPATSPLAQEEQAMKFQLDELHKILRSNTHLKHIAHLLSGFNHAHHLKGALMESSQECDHIIIPPLINLFRAYAGKEEAVPREFRQELCFFLGLLARNEKGRERILAQRGLGLIIREVIQAKNPITIRYCCYAIGNLVTSITDTTGDFYRGIIASGVIQYLISQLELHLDEWQLSQQVFFAIGNLAFIADFETEVLKTKAIPLAINFLKEYSCLSSMASDVIFFLKNMAHGEKGRTEIIGNSGISVAFLALVQNKDCPEFVELTLNLFFDLTFSGAAEVFSQNENMLRFFISILDEHKDNVATVQECIRTLVRIYINSGHCTQVFLLREGLLDHLLMLYTKYGTNEPFTKTIELALSWLELQPPPSYENWCPGEKDEGKIFIEMNNNVTGSSKEVVDRQHNELRGIVGQHQNKCLEISKGRERVPPLLELALRSIKTNNVQYQTIEDLPQDLHHILSNTKPCYYCHGPYSNHFCECILPTTVTVGLVHPVLPIFWRFCSYQCVETVKSQLPSERVLVVG